MLKFAKEFITSPINTGALVPSSDRLAELICESADLKNCSSIVELGPGTGVFTKKILESINKDATFFCIERNHKFVEITRKKCPEINIFEDNAANIEKYVKQLGLEHVDTIVCGLPWANFSVELQNSIMKAVLSSLKPGGTFVTFAYLHGRYMPTGIQFKKLLEKHFSKVESTDLLWLNIPPAFVYKAKK